jgi:hypothetical protein
MDTNFLVNLIEKSTRVILPEFGAFLIKDDGSGVFKPENITFSPFLRYNDGVVEDALSSQNKISKDKAREEIVDFIENLKKELLDKKIFELSGLGFLLLDQRGSILFSTSGEKSSNTKKKEGVASVTKTESESTAKKNEETPEIVDLKKDEPHKESELIIDDKSKDNSKDDILIVEEKPASLPKSKDKPQKHIQETNISTKPMAKPKSPLKSSKTNNNTDKSSGGTGKAILIGTLIGLGLVILLASGWYLYDTGVFKFKDKKASEDIQIAFDEPVIDEKTSKETQAGGKFDDEFSKLSAEMDNTSETVTKSSEKAPEKRIVKKEPTQDNKVTVSYPKEGLFHIIAGSFRNLEFAEKFSAELKSSGFSSKVIVQPSGMHAVSLGSFISREQAADSMNKWKPQHPNIWILQQ